MTMSPKQVTRTIRSIGTTAVVAVTHPASADQAEAILVAELNALDQACSRFRGDSEIWTLYRAAGKPVVVSELLFDVVRTACEVAVQTQGAVDPTVGRCLEQLGYDRDFDLLDDNRSPLGAAPRPAPGWWTVDLDEEKRTVAVPPGARLDVGASAKALAADRIATLVSERAHTGALVSIGGDVAVAGPAPEGGWPVGIAVDSSTPLPAVDVVVAIDRGGLASSSPEVRAWHRGGRHLHHIVDPATGDCVPPYWQLVSVTAPTCVEANALSTAAVVWGADAVTRLAQYRQPVRLVRQDGEVLTLNGWPEDRPVWSVATAVAR
jgi:FAD:protein FMN transferase